MPVITISRELGSSGTYIALKLAQALNCTCYDHQVIHEIAQKLGKDQEQLADFDQSTYNRIGVFFQEALDSIAHGGLVFHPFGIGPLDWESAEIFSSYPRDAYKEKDYFDVLNQVIKDIASADDAIILGRGGSQILKEHHDAYHFRIISDQVDRVAHLVREQEISEEKAEEIIKSRDKAASGFISDFFDVDWNDSHQYHMVLNTSRIKPDACIKVILNYLKRD
ncbi:MAG: AAA family ATPase [Candidatus Rifleibacteriota bacterium]